jgi:hypothetical protein
MNIDFSTFYLISIPGFLVGLMTGRFFAGRHWLSLRHSLGLAGNILSGVGGVAYFVATLITLGIIVVYLVNLPSTVASSNFWITLFVCIWMLINLFFEIRDLFSRRTGG